MLEVDKVSAYSSVYKAIWTVVTVSTIKRQYNLSKVTKGSDTTLSIKDNTRNVITYRQTLYSTYTNVHSH